MIPVDFRPAPPPEPPKPSLTPEQIAHAYRKKVKGGRFPIKELLRRMLNVQSMPFPSVYKLIGTRKGRMVIAGGGPSAFDPATVQWMKFCGLPICAINKTHDELIYKYNIIPEYGMVTDPAPWCLGYQKPHPDVTYLLGSIVDTAVLVRHHSAGSKVFIFHPTSQIGEQEILQLVDGAGEWMVVNGGPTCGSRSFFVFDQVGFDGYDLVGFDSCRHGRRLYTYDKTYLDRTQCYATVTTDNGGEVTFDTTSAMGYQAEWFLNFFKKAKECGIAKPAFRIHGRGIIPYFGEYMGCHASQVDAPVPLKDMTPERILSLKLVHVDQHRIIA